MIQFLPRNQNFDREKTLALAKKCKIEPLLAAFLIERGYEDEDSVYAFLNPSVEQLLSPDGFEQMPDALDCLYAAQSMEEPVCVYGDYDVDGVCATAILSDYLRKEGFQVVSYIPSRHEEGYGLNQAAIEALAEQGVSTIITVDCGITALAEIEFAQSLGMEVVLTDHHQCLEALPDCAAIINPQASAYENKALCGAGVALKLVQAMGGIEAAKEYLDIAALATIADIVDLKGENRAIVALGLEKIRRNETHIGIRALIDVAGYELATIKEQDIAFGLAPRINAAGRLGSAQKGLDLLLCEDEKEAEKLAKSLNSDNELRKKQESDILNEAISQIEAGEADLLNDGAILLCNETWNAGVIGIVAARLMRKYYKPVILFCGENGSLVGSGRSIEGVHLFKALEAFAERFERFGGHEMAAGLSIAKDAYEAFKVDFLAYIQKNTDPLLYIPRMAYDFELQASKVTIKLQQALLKMAPFGTGNPQPRFLLSGMEPQEIRSMGNDHQHLKMKADGLDLVAFGQGDMLLPLQNAKASFLVSLDLNTWNGQTKLQGMVQAMHIDVPDDVKKYIEPLRWKFVDAFCRNLPEAEELTKIDTVAEETAKEEIIQCLREKPQGTLIVCITPETAIKTIQWLRDENLLNQLDIHWGVVEDICAYNTLLLAPDKNLCDFVAYNNYYIMDGDIASCSGIIPEEELFGRLCFLQSDSRNFFESLPYEREKLIPVYQAMRALSMKERSFIDFESYARKINEVYPTAIEATAFALHVFEELGFLERKNGAKFELWALENPPKNDLSQSRIYATVSALLALFEQGS